ncbi:4Fe-4S cluster-binding domain-containing protein [Streptomyces sp. NPDC047070]|uniref:4Fe-4S cluster-binding domain-containing protein n=1 Tax=Streptomyces sp. NPDC047070 TaxID=3154923 RepID=UPI0034568C3B
MADVAVVPVRVADGYFPVETLGPGRRLGVWFQGCELACPGCMSRHTWDAAGGRTATVGELLELWGTALDLGAAGLTVSGGEPLAQPAALAALLLGADRLRRARWPHEYRRSDTRDVRDAWDVSDARDGRDAGEGPPAAPADLPDLPDLSDLPDFPDLLVYTGHEPDEVPGRLPEETWAALDGADAVVTGRFRVAEPTDLVWRGSANQRLVPRTPLGVRRYAPHLARAYPPGPRVSLRADDAGAGARFYGVPARGELRRLERGLAAGGIRLTDPSWRP